MRDQRFAVLVSYDHGVILPDDIAGAIETGLDGNLIEKVTVVSVGEKLHDALTSLAKPPTTPQGE